jgi:hypothetical protein
MANNNLNNIPYAQWLENALRELIDLPVKSICIFATTENGDIYNNYHNITMADKLVMAGIIQQDAMLDTMIANGFIEEEDDDDTEEA